jgi:predicted metal-dependent hydrolase
MLTPNFFAVARAVLSYPKSVSNKKTKIDAMIQDYRGTGFDPHYAGFFDCFNRGQFYEAHDVLEQLWLAERHGPNYSFYKGLIQLAGAFVHLQKNRLPPSAALFKLAQTNLKKYPPSHEHLDLTQVWALIEHWLSLLEQSASNPLTPTNQPKIAPLRTKDS